MDINLDKVPTTLDEALDMLIAGIDEKDLEFISSHQSGEIHHTAGRWLRNSWSLWQRDTPLVTWFIDNLKIAHGDDISSIILESLWRRINKVPLDLPGQVERYHKHWRKMGVDPVTLKQL